jgi:hypothetical protein
MIEADLARKITCSLGGVPHQRVGRVERSETHHIAEPA